jgi:hypothetical protein
VAALVAEGLVDQIVLSTDICQLSHLHTYGGKGYDYLLRSFVPLLRRRGVSEAHVHRRLVDNPRRVLALTPVTHPRAARPERTRAAPEGRRIASPQIDLLGVVRGGGPAV